MLIIDALRHADTAQEICYLLTSYVETLQFYDGVRQLPAGVTQLPVRGLDDVAARLTSLKTFCALDPARRLSATDSAMLDEAMRLFGEALLRLRALDASDTAHFCFDRRAAARPSPAHHA
jgi:hypothetical protein